MRRALVTCIAAALLGAGAAGCGQKGPLYLPGESPTRIEPGIPADEAGRRSGGEEEEAEDGRP